MYRLYSEEVICTQKKNPILMMRHSRRRKLHVYCGVDLRLLKSDNDSVFNEPETYAVR
jgi:hypothetical protein